MSTMLSARPYGTTIRESHQGSPYEAPKSSFGTCRILFCPYRNDIHTSMYNRERNWVDRSIRRACETDDRQAAPLRT